MASTADSVAVFADAMGVGRVAGLSADGQRFLVQAGCNTYSKLALPPWDLAAWRRLWNEAHTLVNSRLRLQSDPVHDSSGPPKVHLQERAATQSEQQKRLSGVNIMGPLEPSHALQDAVYQIKEDGV
eukprot:1224311-Amphidinium_carterae.1